VLIGVISDTHGSLDPRVHDAFRGVDRILHAGDVGTAAVLHELGVIAPVAIEGTRILIVHDRKTLARGHVAANIDFVISGHTHVPMVVQSLGVTFVNPGSVSHPRAGHGPSVALIEIAGDRRTAHIRPL
jgi:predicted phosphodiesterase